MSEPLLSSGQFSKLSLFDDSGLRPPNPGSPYDIFLSYSSKDRDLALRVAYWLADYGKKVYMDCFDKELSAASKSGKAGSLAGILRSNITYSDSLVVLLTPRAVESKWVPWELGYSDGKGKKQATLPVDMAEGDLPDYYFLYPVISTGPNSSGEPVVYSHDPATTPQQLRYWR